MVNHWYDEADDETRCHEYAGETAWHISSNDRVSCPDCRRLLTPEEREGQWYPYKEDESEPVQKAPGVSVTEGGSRLVRQARLALRRIDWGW